MGSLTHLPATPQAKMFNSLKWGGVWFVVFGSILWGADPIFRTPLLASFTSAQIVLLEHLLLAFYAVPILYLYRRELSKLTLRHWGAVLFIAWGGSGLATTLFTAAFQYGNFSVVLLLQKLQPVIALLMARWLLRERLPQTYGFDFLVALVGTYLLTFGFAWPTGGMDDNQMWGSLLALGAALLWGGSTVMGRFLLQDRISFETVTALRFLGALPFMLVLVLLTGDSWSQMATGLADLSTFGLLLLNALLPGLLSILLYYRGLSTTKASYATLAELAFPATGILLNWLVFDQTLTIGQTLGFLIIWVVVFRLSRYGEKTA